jgi:glycosyltransferase involved in cell wall biosynthesis
VRILFYKPEFAWPRASGHDVHTYHMMRAMSELGIRVALATARPSPPEATAGVPFDRLVDLDAVAAPEPPIEEVSLTRFEERFRSYWGTPRARIAALGALAHEFDADAIVVSGLDVLPVLGAIRDRVRVWYAGDEWTWHHLSQVQLSDRRSWDNVRQAAVKGLYERVFRGRIDRAWVVSDADARSLRLVAGVADVDTLPNGVDADEYQPARDNEVPQTAIFWGRLDFGPNIQALEWFVHRIWPRVRARCPSARFTIAGFRPGPDVRDLARIEGVTLQQDLPDIRPLVEQHALVVLPFVSGGGIKNKLLEAASMSKAIVATPRTLLGLKGQPPISLARSPNEWTAAIVALWDDDEARRTMGANAREWVRREHTWRAAALVALSGIGASIDARSLS